MSSEVELSRRDAILTVTMNRPEKRNAMSSTMLARLLETFAGLQQDAETRVVVVRGAGRAFCAGLDLAELAAAKAAQGTVGLTEIGDVFHALERVPQPTIAMVQGEAIAGGCELALHCDLRVAAADVRFAMPLARLGLVIPLPLIQKLLDAMGTAQTKELLFTGDFFAAERVLALHLVNRLVPLAELEEATYGLAETIAANAPLAVRAFKRAIFRANAFRRTIEHEDYDAEVALIAQSEDVAEGVAAMRERRKPRFLGR
ncbi:MAG: enoyl-CoA hydratase/isomerase family protein [Deltaproteobacteria bacterium]|nr:enoyl-CoA hydratase/isomerase family protein [Deltaproteobacteria bacterium]